jgi:Cu+-exporting ATPase
MAIQQQKNFSYLDLPGVRPDYVEDRVFRCFIEGVRCSRCLQKIESAFQGSTDIENVRVDMGQSVLTAELSNSASVSQFLHTIEGLGYPCTPLKADQSAEESFKKAHRHSLYRIGVAGVATGNIMLLSVSLYAGADESAFRGYFEWLTVALFLPVLFFSSTPFYRIAWADWKAKKISIDLPIVLAIVLGALISFYHLIWTGGDIYFDSLAMLVFLLLSSRHFLSQLQQKYLSPKYLKSFLNSDLATVKNADGVWEKKPLADVRLGDEVLVASGEVIPVDGTLISGQGYLNASILTGESRPEKKHQGEELFAGTTWLSGEALLRVTSVGDNSRMGKIFKTMESQLLTKTPLLTLTDRAAKRFTVVIVIIALAFLAYYLPIDATEAVRRSLALIILACPCALAFATPLTQSLSLMKASQLGIIIKNAAALEALHSIRGVLLDKTGTVTFGHFRYVEASFNVMSRADVGALVALEKHSKHPVAFAIIEAFGDSSPPLHIDSVEIIPEGGIRGHIDGHLYEAKRSALANTHDEGTSIDVFKSGIRIATLHFSDSVRPTSKSAIERLKALGLSVQLLTGDGSTPSLKVAGTLGLGEGDTFSSQSPEQKLERVKSVENVMMVGDGVNDAVALAAAQVGVSVQGSMQNSLAASDIYLTQPGIESLDSAVVLSRETYKVIKRNLVFSTAYNIIFGTAALLGFVNPLVAAILMPLSSLTVVISATVGTRTSRRLGRTPRDADTNAMAPIWPNPNLEVQS